MNLRCQACGSYEIVYNGKELICNRCSTVFKEEVEVAGQVPIYC